MIEHINNTDTPKGFRKRRFQYTRILDTAMGTHCLRCKREYDPEKNYLFVITAEGELLMWHRYGSCGYERAGD